MFAGPHQRASREQATGVLGDSRPLTWSTVRTTVDANALTGSGWERGVPQEYLEGLVAYWRDEFDWREQERRLNGFPKFVTTIDGQPIHFLHVRSSEPDALPLIVTHGYPVSIAEFVDLIGPLSNPRAHGGEPADAFHLVVPSLPGFGFSAPLTGTGWEAARTARAWVELMHRLGYERCVAQGGDIGAGSPACWERSIPRGSLPPTSTPIRWRSHSSASTSA